MDNASSRQRILVTGDFWHVDFRHLLANSQVGMSMVPFEQLNQSATGEQDFQLIVLAQSRRDQFTAGELGAIGAAFPNVPLVLLLGSWCEGAQRSGDMQEGVICVYWHQWRGEFDNFCRQMEQHGVSTWNLPATANRIDQMQRDRELTTISSNNPSRSLSIGISAWAPAQFQMLADAIRSLGWQADWLTQREWDGNPDRSYDAICVDANSLTPDVVAQLAEVQQKTANAPIVLVLNFPRSDDEQYAQKLGVAEVVSKPFKLNNLKFAVERAVYQAEEAML